jgi:hypothetical protein
VAAQWVQLGERILLASDHGAWTAAPRRSGAVFLLPMAGDRPATAASTRQLLDGAIAAGERRAPAGAAPEMSAARWAWWLTGQWRSARDSIALIPRAIERFRSDRRAELAAFAEGKLADEQGHERFPLDDLRALGYDAEALVEAVPADPGVLAGLDYARRSLEGPYPLEFLGYMYTLERRMARITPEWLDDVERALPGGCGATSALRLHAGALDREHVEAAVTFIAGLPAGDRAAVATGCFRTTELRCAGLRGAQPTEAELQTWFAPFARAPVCAAAAAPPTPDRGEPQ